MTQYANEVEKRKIALEAHEWANKIKWMHSFDTTQVSMWYDNRRDDGGVCDTQYNDETIVRTITRGPNKGQEIIMQQGVTGEDLIFNYTHMR